MKIGITGANGLIGWHTRAHLHSYCPGIEVRLATRETFSSSEALQSFVSGLDAIVHCAGMNRGNDREVETQNIELASNLVTACTKATEAGHQYPHIVFTNSTHIERNTSYGRGKRLAAEVLAEAAAKHSISFSNLILPHIFGEFGQPFYNSVVATFCHQLIMGEAPHIHMDGDLELIHVQEVAAKAITAIEKNIKGEIRMKGRAISVSELLCTLREMSQIYFERRIVPDLRDPFYLSLFNTLRSYGYAKDSGTLLPLHSDNRGTLFEAIKTENGGQAFISTTFPGVTRGNHYHTHKFERFLVCSGQAEIRIRKLFTDEIRVFRVTGDQPCYVDMPTFHTHNILNTGNSELVTLFWVNEIFNQENPDTFSEAVQ